MNAELERYIFVILAAVHIVMTGIFLSLFRTVRGIAKRADRGGAEMNVPITVAELIEMLEKFPQDAVIVNNNLDPASVSIDMEVEGLVVEVD